MQFLHYVQLLHYELLHTISVDQCMEEFNFEGILENNLYILLELHRIDCVIHQKKDPKILLTKIIPTDSHLHTYTHKKQIPNCIVGHLLFQSDYGMVNVVVRNRDHLLSAC